MTDHHRHVVGVVVPPAHALGKPPLPAGKERLCSATLHTRRQDPHRVEHLAVFVQLAHSVEHGHVDLWIGEVMPPCGLLMFRLGNHPTAFQQAVGVVVQPREQLAEVAPGWKCRQRHHRRLMPCRVHDPQVRSHQRKRQTFEEGEHLRPCRRVGPVPGVVTPVVRSVLVPEPVVAGLALTAQQVEFVVAEDARCPPAVDQALYQSHDTRAVRTAVDKVAQEHEMPAIGVAALFVVAGHSQQGQKCVQLAVHIANDVQRAVR